MTVVRVGGKVTAIDRDVRFLDRLDAPNVEVIASNEFNQFLVLATVCS
jgi:hypothetical protein